MFRSLSKQSKRVIGFKKSIVTSSLLLLGFLCPLSAKQESYFSSSFKLLKKYKKTVSSLCSITIVSVPLLYWLYHKKILNDLDGNYPKSDSGITVGLKFDDMISVTTKGSSGSGSTISFPADKCSVHFPNVTKKSAETLLSHFSRQSNSDSSTEGSMIVELHCPDTFSLTTQTSSGSLRSTISFPAKKWNMHYASLTKNAAETLLSHLLRLNGLTPEQQEADLQQYVLSRVESEEMQT